MPFALDPTFPTASQPKPSARPGAVGGIKGNIKPSGPPIGGGTMGGIINQADVDAAARPGLGLGGLALAGVGGLILWKIFG